jgi:hypothetical protein
LICNFSSLCLLFLAFEFQPGRPRGAAGAPPANTVKGSLETKADFDIDALADVTSRTAVYGPIRTVVCEGQQW